MSISSRLLHATFAALLAAAPASAHEYTNGRITVDQADGSGGLSTTNSDRIDAISWVDSTGTSTGNIAANGNSVVCGDPEEFFGESYGDGDDAEPYMVIYGTVSSWKPSGTLGGTAHTNGRKTCVGYQQDGTVSTRYLLSMKPARVSALQIRRSFTFNAHAAGVTYNLRGYVPRFPISRYPTVLVPDASGAIQTLNATSCNTACPVSSWNGTWFADDDGSGNGIAVIRDHTSTFPAMVEMDNDGASASNLTSIVLQRPADGWSGTITETDYLCFYDPTTWTAKQRAHGTLPAGCKVPAVKPAK
jgi:hypothetical protein